MKLPPRSSLRVSLPPEGARLLATMALLAGGAALASPTDNEYQQCHRMAAATLQYCLDESPGNLHGPGCWETSRRIQKRCYGEVRASHQRPPRPPPQPPAPVQPTPPRKP